MAPRQNKAAEAAETVEETVVEATEATNEEAVEAPVVPEATSPAAQLLATWTGLSPRLYRQDAKVLDFLTENGPTAESVIKEKFSDLSTWTFRRMATGIHHKRTEGVPVIERVSVEGAKGWKLTDEAAAYVAPVEEPAEAS